MTTDLLLDLSQSTAGLAGALLQGDISRIEAALPAQESCIRRLEGALAALGPGPLPPTSQPTQEVTALIRQLRQDLDLTGRLARQGLAMSRRLSGLGPAAELAYRLNGEGRR
ncbi:MAG TPA: hypothetical protein DEQ28_07975 [Clostridiales bacterium]|nr:hypothetical protein [Clostridiales bacterium]